MKNMAMNVYPQNSLGLTAAVFRKELIQVGVSHESVPKIDVMKAATAANSVESIFICMDRS